MTSSPSGPALPTLIVTGGPSDGMEVSLDGPGTEKTIGSAPNSHLRLTSQNVDAIHAVVTWENAAVQLTDAGSAAGTFVNGERVESDHVLQDGDRISIGPPGSPGSVKLLVRVPGNLAGAGGGASLGAEAQPPGEPEIPDFGEPAGAAAGADVLFEESPDELVLGGPEARAPAAAEATPVPAVIFDEPAPAKEPARPAPPAAKPDYMTELPSIGGDRVREPLDLPPAEAPPPRPVAARPRRPARRAPPPDVVRLAVIGVGAAVVTWGAFFAYLHLHAPAPVLSAIMPPKVDVGGTVTLTGTGFETTPTGNVVRFANTVAAVTNASATSLAVTVPALPGSATAKEVPVTVQGRGGRSNALFVKIARLPRVARVEPDVAVPGAEITIHGANLDGAPLVVRIGIDRVTPREARADALKVTVPDIPWTDGQSVPVTVEVGPDSARPVPLLLGRLPMVTEVTPSAGPIGQRVVIKGRGFDPAPAGNRLTIGGEPALIFAASATELRAAVPAPALGAPAGALPVLVEVRGASSSGRTTFSLAHSMSGLVRLRFFPAPAGAGRPDRYAFVSTELGPVLLLGGKADAPSTAERANKVAATLTELMEAATSRPVALEVREGATPSVAVSGGAVVVTATPDDAEAYAQPWEGARPVRATPRQVAAYWSAVLQDYLSLFGQGQRPSRTAELSTRGKVLVDVYAEAQRRGTAGGVPVATLTGLSSATLKAIREMALLLPGPGAATPGMAVAGRWEGTMADAEGERAIGLELRAEGGQLTGSLVSKTGKLDVRTPLQQVSYDKGQLKFVAAAGGATRQFRGALDGSALAGSIFNDATARDAVGRFSLRYVE